MGKEIIMGYWNCESCGARDIEGLLDVCPNCSARKPAHIRYHRKEKDVVLKREQLQQAGIGEEECDGEHKEWVCAYCGYLNNYADHICKACDAPKSESQQQYGDEPEKKVATDQKIVTESDQQVSDVTQKPRKKRGIWKWIAALFLLLLIIGFFPQKQVWTVTGFQWEREITVEEMQIVEESDWYVPDGAKVYDKRQEIRSYTQQISHYEEVTVTKSRQVIDHYEEEYEYTDNGNGTFTKTSYQVPVYKTEYYEETEKQPVYVSVPVFDTKYYYEIEKWFDGEKYLTSGEDHEPYWEENYTLEENQRDTKRREAYYVIYDKGESAELTLDEWNTYHPGDTYTVTTCRLGIIYGEEKRKAAD